jgi:hypothetical protein
VKLQRIFIVPIVLSVLVAALWSFPSVWYTKTGNDQPHWFGENTNISGWDYVPVPVSASAERTLVADRVVNGEFNRAGRDPIRVFSAKRFEEKVNEIGLFVHTPDRCWVESGWKIEPIAPDLRALELHGLKILVERRIFNFKEARELVYFFGLVGGAPLPYRLDHNLSVGVRSKLAQPDTSRTALVRVSDTHYWSRLWESFTSRRELFGPKQFIRISTPVHGEDLHEADQRLEKFLGEWLLQSDYQEEKKRSKQT